MNMQTLLPSLVTQHPRYGGLMDVKTFRQFGLIHSAGEAADFACKLIRQFRRWPAANVLRDRYGFEMIGVDARTVTAQVVNRKPIWDWTPHLFIEVPSSTKGFTITHKIGVSVSDLPLPHPARRFVAAILDRVHGAVLGASTTVVPAYEARRFASDNPLLSDRLSGKRSALATSTLTQAGRIGFICSILGMHLDRLLHRLIEVPHLGRLPPRRGTLRASIIPHKQERNLS